MSDERVDRIQPAGQEKSARRTRTKLTFIGGSPRRIGGRPPPIGLLCGRAAPARGRRAASTDQSDESEEKTPRG